MKTKGARRKGRRNEGRKCRKKERTKERKKEERTWNAAKEARRLFVHGRAFMAGAKIT